MTSDHTAQQLHDQATRGAALSAEEQGKLDEWYARQDQEEAFAIALTPPSPRIVTLQANVNAAIAQLLTVTQRIQTQTAENESVRREITALKQQLAQSQTTQPA